MNTQMFYTGTDEEGNDGYCATTHDDEGKEVILSQCFKEGTTGVGKAMREIVEQLNTIPTISMRYMMLQHGIRAEMRGMRLTSKAPAASAIIKNEFGLRKGLSKKKTGVAFSMLLSLAQMLLEEQRGEE
tara:strand:- start:770 stop:1156 length:387 start_codon:yes stop_codon:yes gene_type:complete